MCPTRIPPSGRATKPTAKVANAASDAPESRPAKNSGPMMSPAAVPYNA